jgi:hypothetical protein
MKFVEEGRFEIGFKRLEKTPFLRTKKILFSSGFFLGPIIYYAKRATFRTSWSMPGGYPRPFWPCPLEDVGGRGEGPAEPFEHIA